MTARRRADRRASTADPAPTCVIDAARLRGRPGLRRLPHAPAVRRLARGGVRAEGHRRPLRGDRARAAAGSRRSARALAEASDDEVLAQARGARAPRCSRTARRRSRARPATGSRVEGELRARSRLARASVARRPRHRRCSPTPSRTATTPTRWMDEVDALAARVRRRRARHLRRVGRLRQRAPRAAGRDRARATGVPLRAHVEQFNANRSVPVALAAGARSVDHLACLHPDDLAPLAAAECAAVLLPGAEFLGAERVAPARALADAGAICVLATDCNPGTSPVASLPLDHRAGRAPLRLDARARRCWRARSTPRGCCGCPASSARSRSASAPTWSCSTARSSTSPTASGATRWRR